MESSEEITPFNWHEADRDSFMHWAVIAMISDGVPNGVAENVLAASNGGRDLKIQLNINGVVFNGMPFFERLWQELQRQAKAHAAELVEDELVKLRDTTAFIERTLSSADADIRSRLRALGFPLTEEYL